MTTRSDVDMAIAGRVQRVVAIVEEILCEIAKEHDDPRKTASAMAEFFTDLLPRILRLSHERLVAFMRHAHQPND